MTEISCDNYMLKVLEIKTICNDVNCSFNALQTKLNELEAIDNQIDDDNIVMSVPTKMVHLNKYILTQITRGHKMEIHSAILNLIKIKKEHFRSILHMDCDFIAVKEFEANTIAMETFSESVIGNCCMNELTCIINHITKK